MNIVVTTTAGFIGSHVAMYPLERGEPEQCLGKKESKMEIQPPQDGDVPDTEADVSELIAAVDYRPQVSVEEGVGRFVEWYRGYYGS